MSFRLIMSTVKLKSKNIRDSKRAKYYLPFSFLASTTFCPELKAQIYLTNTNGEGISCIKKTSYVSFNYEKYCNTFKYATEIDKEEKVNDETKSNEIQKGMKSISIKSE